MNELGSGIWQVSGSSPGPNVIVLGGVHGDEKTGLEVVKDLRTLVDSGELQLCRGSLNLALGNEEAFRMDRRATAPDRNLNRMFTRSHLEGPALDFYESRRAKEQP